MTRRHPATIRTDIRNWLGYLVVAQLARCVEGILVAKREIRALELELVYNRYGRTDVT